MIHLNHSVISRRMNMISSDLFDRIIFNRYEEEMYDYIFICHVLGILREGVNYFNVLVSI